MNIIGEILHFIGERPAEAVAIGLIIVFSSWKADNPLQGVRIFLFLVLFGAFLAAIPVCVVFLATNGDLSLLNVGRVGGWADRAAIGCDFLIPVFLIVVPSLLRKRLAWDSAGTAVQALLPTWLAMLAAAATVGLVSTLHFVKGGQLANMRPTLVIVAIVGIVALILPLYSLLARECWQHGYWLGFFDPPQWWKEQGAVLDAVRNAFSRHGAVAGRGHPHEADNLGDLLASLMLHHFGQPVPSPMLARLRQVTQLDAATGTGPDAPPTAPLDKLLTELREKVKTNAQGGEH